MSTLTLDGMRCSCDGIHRQVQRRRAVGPVSIDVDLADLHAAHLDLGVGVHHQAGAIRDDGHRNGFGEAAPEQADRERDDRSDRRPPSPSPPAARTVLRFIGVPPYPDRLKLPLEP